MPAESIGKMYKFSKKHNRGMSTLEILLAFAILILTITAVIGVGFGNQSITVDAETNTEALTKAAEILEDARAQSRSDFNEVNSSIFSTDLIYSKQLVIEDLTPCKKQATSTITWNVDGGRTQTISLGTFLTNVVGTLALGGDCATEPPTGGWNPPALFARDTINPGKFTALDALNRIVYLASDNKKPYLYIADIRNAVFNNTSDQPLIIGSSIPYTNSFNSSGIEINEINDIDIVNTNGRNYVFIAMASTTSQLAIIDVTDILKPELIAKRQLNGITATDSTAWGWRLYYYDKKIYITARETAGPELHIFNVSSTTNPLEIGSKELNTTVNDFIVRDGLAFFADESDARGPLLIYDVSTSTNINEIVGARTKFLDNDGNINNDENGESVYLLGNKLYFGREKTSSGPEFYILDVSNPRIAVGGLPIFGPNDSKKEMDKDITDIRVIGNFAFLASYGDSSGGFKVWNISNPLNIQPINLTFNFGNKLQAIDYGDGFIYAAGGSTPNFQVLCSGPITGGKCK